MSITVNMCNMRWDLAGINEWFTHVPACFSDTRFSKVSVARMTISCIYASLAASYHGQNDGPGGLLMNTSPVPVLTGVRLLVACYVSRRARRPRSSQRCSMGTISGESDGQSITCT